MDFAAIMLFLQSKFLTLRMDLSQVKMVVTDMDGTLLNSKSEVSAEFFKLFEGLKSQNVRFVAASGRQYSSIQDKLMAIFEEITIIDFLAYPGKLLIDHSTCPYI